MHDRKVIHSLTDQIMIACFQEDRERAQSLLEDLRRVFARAMGKSQDWKAFRGISRQEKLEKRAAGLEGQGVTFSELTSR